MCDTAETVIVIGDIPSRQKYGRKAIMEDLSFGSNHTVRFAPIGPGRRSSRDRPPPYECLDRGPGNLVMELLPGILHRVEVGRLTPNPGH